MKCSFCDMDGSTCEHLRPEDETDVLARIARYGGRPHFKEEPSRVTAQADRTCAGLPPPTPEELRKQTVKKFMDLMTDAGRLDVMLNYCRYCGCKDPQCQCWNDK